MLDPTSVAASCLTIDILDFVTVERKICGPSTKQKTFSGFSEAISSFWPSFVPLGLAIVCLVALLALLFVSCSLVTLFFTVSQSRVLHLALISGPDFAFCFFSPSLDFASQHCTWLPTFYNSLLHCNTLDMWESSLWLGHAKLPVALGLVLDVSFTQSALPALPSHSLVCRLSQLWVLDKAPLRVWQSSSTSTDFYPYTHYTDFDFFS